MLGDRLKQIRKEKNLSQKAFADPLSTSSGYISEVEQGKKAPGSDFLTSLSRVYGVSIDWLLTGAGEAFPKKSADINLEPPQLNPVLLKQVIEGVEIYLKEGKSVLPPEIKARLISLLYDYYAKTGEEVDRRKVVSYIKLVA